MNLNNLESLRQEMNILGFSDELAKKMEQFMREDHPNFVLHDKREGLRGQAEMNIYFKQSGQSDYYYLNKFEVTMNEGTRLENNQRYMVVTPAEKRGEPNQMRVYTSVSEAIENFRLRKTNAELLKGNPEKPDTRELLAGMENGKINYVAKDFVRTFRNPPTPQTFWLDRGKGFTASQAVNLMEGRAVYRADLLNVAGEPYKAWTRLDLEGPKDRFKNFAINQYHDPAYGFDLKQVLERFNIKELDDPKLYGKIEASLKNGDRATVSVERDGEREVLKIEAVPRYSQVNFYSLDGKPQKREQFLKSEINNSQKKQAGKDHIQQRQVSRGL
ncbi:hypothetical protein [Pedobacter sp. SYP-B3415]|uniref:hypothetical protein n=1 Tax=Pedobacter sp. SYP-B3415 TaxID=2496641 RepID=UPI00101C4652|nr:hypothetical protein [Pedobacter sp. SYP-B3415]